MINKTKEIEQLIEQAAKSGKSDDAMRYSQAAVNAANALFTANEVLSRFNEGVRD